MDYTKVAEAIDRQAKTYQAIIDAAAALKEIGSLDNMANDCRAAAEVAREDLSKVQAEAKAAKAEVTKAKNKAGEILIKANDQALEVMREAEQKSQAIVDGASVRAGEIVATAERQAADRTAGVAGQVAQLTSTKVSLEQDVASLQDVIGRKQIEVEDLEKRLAKAQAQIAKLLG